jgi:hypothetical protein
MATKFDDDFKKLIVDGLIPSKERQLEIIGQPGICAICGELANGSDELCYACIQLERANRAVEEELTWEQKELAYQARIDELEDENQRLRLEVAALTPIGGIQ